MTRIRIYGPAGSVGLAATAAAAPVDVLAGRQLAALDNGKPGADVLLARVAARVAERTGARFTGLRRKGSAATPCEPALLDELAVSADLVLTGTAD